MPKQDEAIKIDYGNGGFVGAVLTIVVAGLAWAILTSLVLNKLWLALALLGWIIVLSAASLIAWNRFPTQKWRIVGAVLFIVACTDLYLVNAWWDTIITMWMGMHAGEATVKPLMINCILIGFIGAGSMLFLQLRPEDGIHRSSEKPMNKSANLSLE